MPKLNPDNKHQTKDGFPVRYLGMTSNDGHLIWEASKPSQGDVVFKTTLFGNKIGGGISAYWDVVPVPAPIVKKWLWLSTAQFMDPKAIVASIGNNTSNWSDEAPQRPILRPGSIWYECQIDTGSGNIVSMNIMEA